MQFGMTMCGNSVWSYLEVSVKGSRSDAWIRWEFRRSVKFFFFPPLPSLCLLCPKGWVVVMAYRGFWLVASMSARPVRPHACDPPQNLNRQIPRWERTEGEPRRESNCFHQKETPRTPRIQCWKLKKLVFAKRIPNRNLEIFVRILIGFESGESFFDQHCIRGVFVVEKQNF